MKRVVGVVVACACTFLPPREAAGYNCEIGGEHITVVSSLWLMFPMEWEMGSMIAVDAQTNRTIQDAQYCPGWMRVEAWIDGSSQGAIVKQSEVVAQIELTATRILTGLAAFAPAPRGVHGRPAG